MSRPVLIFLISALVTLGPFTNNIMVPSLPSIASGLQITFSDAQLILSVFMVGFAAGQLFVGPMSDRFGRKPVLVISLSLFVVASGLCAIAPDPRRYRVPACTKSAPAPHLSVGRAIVRTPFHPTNRAGLRLCRHGLALIIGSIFGGLIEVSAVAGKLFVFVGVFGALTLISILVLRGKRTAS